MNHHVMQAQLFGPLRALRFAMPVALCSIVAPMDASLREATVDCHLCFVANDGTDKLLKQVPAHRLVLGKASQYFHAKVVRWSDSPAGTAKEAAADGTIHRSKKARMDPPEQGMLTRIDTHIPADALTEAEALVEFMYTGTLSLPPAEASEQARSLLQATLIAESWALPTCVQQCIKDLATLATGTTLDLEPVLPTLPDSITSMPEFEQLLQTNYASTLAPFRKGVHELVADASDRGKQFRSLSPLLIKLWADGSLQANSEQENSYLSTAEETVVLLFTRWWLAQTPAIQQDEDLCLARSHSLHVCRLSAIYLTLVLPTLPWFRGAKSEAYIQILNRKILGPTIAMEYMPPYQGHLPEAWGRLGWVRGRVMSPPPTPSESPSWSPLCMRRVRVKPPNTTLIWQLAEPLLARNELPSQYLSGFNWGARVDATPGDPFYGIKIQVIVSLPVVGVECLAAAVRCVRANIRWTLLRVQGDQEWFLASDGPCELQGTIPHTPVAGVAEIGQEMQVMRKHLTGRFRLRLEITMI